MREQLNLPADAGKIRSIAFYAVPSTGLHAGLTPIYAEKDSLGGSRGLANAIALGYVAATEAAAGPGAVVVKDRSGQTVGYAWRNPQSVLTLDFELKPTPVPVRP